MKDFRSLQKKHEQLLSKQQFDFDVTKDAQEYLESIKADSSEIVNANERDQLRSNLRYWASYIYEKTGKFPNTELASPSAKVVTKRRWVSFALTTVLFVIVATIALYVIQVFPVNPSNSTATAYIASPIVPSLTTTPFSIPLTPTGENINISFSITYPQNGQTIPPEVTIRGQYSNLGLGQSICIFVQPLSKSGKIYPLANCYTVSHRTSGDWSLNVRFGNKEELLKSEKYILMIGIAPDEQYLALIEQGTVTGFDEMPNGILISPQSVTVTRLAYIAIEEIRIIFSNYISGEFNVELFSAKLDGTDLQRLTYTNSINELFPNVSPDGKKIVTVGLQTASAQISPHYQLIIMQSDGSSSIVISEENNAVYEHPIWSPDGKFIAYAVGIPEENEGLSWKIHLYDIVANITTRFRITTRLRIVLRDFKVYTHWRAIEQKGDRHECKEPTYKPACLAQAACQWT